MNKYVSPIIEIELIDVEDIMTSWSTGNDDAESDTTGTGGTGEGKNEGPLMPIDAMNYFNNI